jgi:hypothetical protein
MIHIHYAMLSFCDLFTWACKRRLFQVIAFAWTFFFVIKPPIVCIAPEISNLLLLTHI